MSERAKIISVEECSVPPVLVNFQNTCPDRDVEVQLARVNKDDGHKAKVPLLIVASKETVYSGFVEDNPLVNNFLVIRNKRKNTARLIPYTSCSLISEHYTNVPQSIPSTEKDELALKHSIAKYGGKNAMRAHDRINRMKMNIDVIKDQLDQTISLSSEQMKLEHMEEERLLDGQDEGVEPVKNYDAKTVYELYNFKDILSQELAEDLEEIVVQVLDTKPSDLPLPSDFLMDKFRALQANGKMTDAEKSLSVKAIIFADALRTLILESSRKGRRPILQRISMSQICESVEMNIRRTFMDPKSVNGALTLFTRRKAICHFLILAILLSPKLEVSTDEMIAELKLRKEELLDFARFLNLRTALNSSFLGLRLPKNKKDDDSRKIRRVKKEKKK